MHPSNCSSAFVLFCFVRFHFVGKFCNCNFAVVSFNLYLYINNHKVNNWSFVGWFLFLLRLRLDRVHFFFHSTVCDKTPAAFLIELYKMCSDKLIVQMCYAEKRMWIYFSARCKSKRKTNRETKEWVKGTAWKWNENNNNYTNSSKPSLSHNLWKHFASVYKSPLLLFTFHYI